MKKNQRTVLIVICILSGTTFLISAGIYLLDLRTTEQPPGLGETMLVVGSFLVSLVTLILALIEKKKASIQVTGDGPVAAAPGSRVIQTGTYIENQYHLPAAPQLDALHGLPSPPEDFTGRKDEIEQAIKDIRGGVRIYGVQGMGGLGKTALGLAIAHQLKSEYHDAWIFMDLHGAAEGEGSSSPQQILTDLIHRFQPEAKLPEKNLQPIFYIYQVSD